MVVLIIGLSIVFLGVIIYLCIVKPIAKKSEYSNKKDSIFVGMSEADMITKCGTPSKTVVIDDDCKLVSYTLDEWKGFLFGGSSHREITATVKHGVVTNISVSD